MPGTEGLAEYKSGVCGSEIVLAAWTGGGVGAVEKGWEGLTAVVWVEGRIYLGGWDDRNVPDKP